MSYGPLTVTNSTFLSNSATIEGGGIYSYGPLTVTNSTFSDNSAGYSWRRHLQRGCHADRNQQHLLRQQRHSRRRRRYLQRCWHRHRN